MCFETALPRDSPSKFDFLPYPMGEGGTIDLDWGALTPEFGEKLVELLNTALSTATRPSFIGPISVSAFEFGDLAPNLELVDIRDIYPDFLEDSDEEESEGSGEHVNREPLPHPDDFEWISDQERMQGEAMSLANRDSYAYRAPLSRHNSNLAASEFGARQSQGRAAWDPRRGTYTPGLGNSIASLHDPRFSLGASGIFGGANLSNRSTPPPFDDSPRMRTPEAFPPERGRSFPPLESSDPSPSPPHLDAPDAAAHPDLQLHFRMSFESNLRFAINTSLQINYPSPLIMSLPVKLAVTGLVFEGELVVAYEGSRKRVHVCVLDEQGHGGPVPASSSHDDDDRAEDDQNAGQEEHSSNLGEKAVASSRIIASGSTVTTVPSRLPLPTTPSKLSVPAGLRLLPSIFIESEIGQEDKHVLRNVGRVERFIQDVIRRTLEEELVYPNFQTIVLPSGQAEG